MPITQINLNHSLELAGITNRQVYQMMTDLFYSRTKIEYYFKRLGEKDSSRKTVSEIKIKFLQTIAKLKEKIATTCIH